MQISESNSYTFMSKFLEAVKDGWRAVNTNEGYISQAFLYEIKMFPKEENEEIIPLFTEHKISIESYDAMNFVMQVQTAALQGYEFDMKSFDWMATSVKRIKGENKSHPKAKVYTREELDEMDWNDLRPLFQSYGIKGRHRDTVTVALMKAQQGEQ